MNLVRSAIRYPVSTIVGVLLVVLFGVVALVKLPVQLAPDVEKHEVTVDTRWPGGSPLEVEREIIDEQEEQLKGVEGLEKMFSESSYGQGKVILRFPTGTNTDTALLQVSNRLRRVWEAKASSRIAAVDKFSPAGPRSSGSDKSPCSRRSLPSCRTAAKERPTARCRGGCQDPLWSAP